MSTTRPTFAALLGDGEPDPGSDSVLRKLRRHALIPLAVAGGLLALWSLWAPLSGAIIAPGKLKAEMNRKTVQHQEGGIVRQILVRDGQQVRKGQPLIVVGDVGNEAELNLLQEQFAAERVRHARAMAEAALAAAFTPEAGPAPGPGAPRRLDFSADGGDRIAALGKRELAPDLAEVRGQIPGYIARETALFNARRRTLNEQVSALEGQIREAQQQAAALSKQIEATEASATLARDELQLNEKVVREGYVPRTRLLQLQRDESDYRGRISESQSELALARQRAGDLQARIAQLRNQYQQQATDEARESAATIRELEERLRPSQDEAERRFVRAPVDGKVMSLRVASVGDVIGPRDPILEIVPTQEKLVVEAHIRPQDINHVREHSAAEVRLSSFDARTTPLLPGRVTFVSADRVTAPETGQSWFVATVEVDASALTSHPEIELQSGMPAELFVTTPERTLFQYLAKPLNAFASRAMREP